jgi:hypothetical protein
MALREVRHGLKRQHAPTLGGDQRDSPAKESWIEAFDYLEKRPRPKKPRRASTRMMMRIQSQIDMKPFRRVSYVLSSPRPHPLNVGEDL